MSVQRSFINSNRLSDKRCMEIYRQGIGLQVAQQCIFHNRYMEFFKVEKDIFTLISTALTTAVSLWTFFKDGGWSLSKAKKFSLILEKYKGFMSEREVEFAKKEIERNVKQNILRIKDANLRSLILFVRINSELIMPWWRWGHIVCHIQYKYNKFFIRYNGKYRHNRYLFMSFAIFCLVVGVGLVVSSRSEPLGFRIMGYILLLFYSIMSILFWNILPGEKIIKKYNKELLNIDGSKYLVE